MGAAGGSPDATGANEYPDGATCEHAGSITSAHGSCLVKLGHTAVVAGVKAEVAVPPTDKPAEGCLGTPPSKG